MKDSSGGNVIKGISIFITGSEPAGFAIDNITFTGVSEGGGGEITVTPAPATLLLLAGGL